MHSECWSTDDFLLKARSVARQAVGQQWYISLIYSTAVLMKHLQRSLHVIRWLQWCSVIFTCHLAIPIPPRPALLPDVSSSVTRGSTVLLLPIRRQIRAGTSDRQSAASSTLWMVTWWSSNICCKCTVSAHQVTDCDLVHSLCSVIWPTSFIGHLFTALH